MILSNVTISQALSFSKDPMLILDCDGLVTWCNHAYADVVKMNFPDIIGGVPIFMCPRSIVFITIYDIETATATKNHWSTSLDYLPNAEASVTSFQTEITRFKDSHGKASYFVTQIDMTNQRKHMQDLLRIANHDRLTGLPNSAMFTTVLHRAILNARRNRGMVHLMMIDLDGFKKVNDTFGHSSGDFLLREISSRIHATIRESDFAARLGGDEFVVILSDITDTDHAMSIAEKMIALINQPVTSPLGNHLRVGASIGIAVYPNHGETDESIKERADAAMYHSKHSGRNVATLFHPDTTPEMSVPTPPVKQLHLNLAGA